MKTRIGSGRFLLVAALVVFFTPAGRGQDNDGKVTFHDNGIVIHPGTKISKEDEKKLNDVLKNYDKRLYRVEKYKDGKVVKVQGELKNGPGPKDIFIDAKTASEVAAAKAAGVTDYGPVFETGPYDRQVPLQYLEGGKAMGKRLLEEVKPILQRYAASKQR